MVETEKRKRRRRKEAAEAEDEGVIGDYVGNHMLQLGADPALLFSSSSSSFFFLTNPFVQDLKNN